MTESEKEQLRKWLDNWPKLSYQPDGYEENAEFAIKVSGENIWLPCMLVADKVYYSPFGMDYWYERKITSDLEIRLKGE